MFGPLIPDAAAFARESNESRVVVGMSEDPRLASGLTRPGQTSLVQTHRHALLPQRVRRRQTNDPTPDRCYLG
ncbi:hypothetical protein MICRO11B_370005 [Micrococcus luteus]|nr:hypothetical protein MICRO11B_370005 [Micrococcus luteus]